MQEEPSTMTSTQHTAEQRSRNGSTHEKNVGEVERWASMIGGTALAFYGLKGSVGKLALLAGGGMLMYRAISGHCPAYEALGVHTVSQEEGAGVHLTASLTINKPAEEVYRFWHNLENLPRFMTHLESVTSTGNKRSHWVAKVPVQGAISWDAEMVEERANECLAWRSLPGADVEHEGSVHFRQAPGGRGTEVQVALQYRPPGGAAGTALARLLNTITTQQVKEDLRRVKQILEAGENPTIAEQPVGAQA